MYFTYVQSEVTYCKDQSITLNQVDVIEGKAIESSQGNCQYVLVGTLYQTF